MSDASSAMYTRLQWAVFALLAVTQVVLLAKLVLTESDFIKLLVAIVAVPVLLLVNIRIGDLSLIIFGRSGLRAELNSVKDQLQEADKRISQLFLFTMSPAMYLNLKKLARGQFGRYEKGAGLVRELYLLHDLGFIDVPNVEKIPSSGDNLSEHVTITRRGKEFVELREEMEQRVSQQHA